MVQIDERQPDEVEIWPLLVPAMLHLPRPMPKASEPPVYLTRHATTPGPISQARFWWPPTFFC